MPEQNESSKREKTITMYDTLIATLPSVERKGKTMPYTSINGHMFSFISKEEELALRLPKDTREKFIERYHTTLCEQYGKVMKEYVVVPTTVLADIDEIKTYVDISYSYVKSLKPKPSKN